MQSKCKGLLQGKNAIITGCNRGIGKAIMVAFAENGANIWACAREANPEFELFINNLAELHQVKITPVYFDLTDEKQIAAGIRQIVAEKRDIDILVNNAGAVLHSKSFNMTTIEEMKNIFQINFYAPVLMTQYVTRKMILKKKGCVINMISIAALDSDHGQFEYVTSKAALAAATKKLARELSVYNIRVNAVAPGLTDTDMLGFMPDEVKSGVMSKNITGRLGRTEEIADSVLFLASDMSTYINGQIIRVDGGF